MARTEGATWRDAGPYTKLTYFFVRCGLTQATNP